MSPLEELAQHGGIAPSYVDARDERRETPVETQAALLEAMGYRVDLEGVGAALEDLEQGDWLTPLPPVTVHGAAGPPTVHVTLQQGMADVGWCLTLESGDQQRGRLDTDAHPAVATRTVAGITYSRRRLLLGAEVPFGYHTLELGPGGTTMVLIVAPPRCWLPREFAAGERLWGMTAQL
jgi:hypothetical protein